MTDIIDPDFIDPITRKVSHDFLTLLNNCGTTNTFLPYSIPSFFDHNIFEKWIIEQLSDTWGRTGYYPAQLYFKNLNDANEFENFWTVKNHRFHEIILDNRAKITEIHKWANDNNLIIKKVGYWQNYDKITCIYEVPDLDHGIFFKLRWG